MNLLLRYDDRLRLLSFVGWCVIWLAIVWAIVDPSPVRIGFTSDKVIHFTSFFAISLACLTFCRSVRQLGLASVFCAAAGVLLEITHYVIPRRSFELADMAANVSGVATGALIALFLLRVLQRRLMPAPAR